MRSRVPILLLLLAMAGWGQQSKLAGTWVRSAGGAAFRLELKQDGTGLLNGQPLQWQYTHGVLLLKEGENVTMAPVEVSDNSLTLAPVGQGRLEFRREKPAEQTQACRGLVGSWRSPDSVITLAADGTTTIAGVDYRYTADGNTITLTGADGTFRFPYELNGGVLKVDMNGRPMTLTCVQPGAASTGPNPVELTGKWCAMSNVNASNGGRMSSSCIVLNADGTYRYNAETSSSGPIASQATQEWDEGTWTATATSIIAHSRTRGTTTVYTLEKRNHPKNRRDPMIVLNGQPFVTYGPRQPW